MIVGSWLTVNKECELASSKKSEFNARHFLYIGKINMFLSFTSL